MFANGLTWIPLVVLLTAPAVPETNRVVLRVNVNTVDQGDFFLRRTSTGDILVTSDDLAGLDLHLPTEVAPIGSIVSLSSLAPLVRFEMDERTATLRIMASPEILPRHDVVLAPLQQPVV